MSESIFSAQEPTLGYLYQINLSLLLLLQSSDIDDSKIAIEQLDDIQLSQPDFTKLFQTKYHLKSIANLTDRSTDLWKTLRVWCEGCNSGIINPDTTAFHLITTAQTSPGSLSAELKKVIKERDVSQIILQLEVIASETSNQSNKDAYKAFNSLTKENKGKLIRNIHLFDSSSDINEVKKKIFSELRKTIIDDKVPALYDRLLGWYLGQVIRNLLGEIEFISFLELQKKCFEIIDGLKTDNLPADFPHPIEFNETELAQFKKRRFVKQLSLIGINDKSLKNAISDYHRAFEQRSKWIRDVLIKPQEEIDYEARLHEDWKRKFDAIVGDCQSADDTTKANLGKNFYVSHYVINSPRIYIKERFDHIYMVTGSCQILADRKKIGWHPDYESKV